MPPFINLEYFYYLIYRFFTEDFTGARWGMWAAAVIFWLKVILLLLTPLLLGVVTYLSARVSRLRQRERRELRTMLEAPLERAAKNERWEKIMAAIASDNPTEWKFAIIEADNILDEMVKKMHTVGDNLGERLQGIEPSDFLTLDDAWEAHKVRNRIAHESGFVLTQHQMRETIARYKRVFEEFEYL